MIRNYTSTVSVERSVSAIEQKLVACGARNIAKTYDDKRRICAMVFDLPGENGKFYPVRLPGHAERIYETLVKSRSRIRNYDELKDQSQRTAWKLMLDWVDVQISLIHLNQVKPLEVFMPFLWDGKRTMYEYMEANGFKMLPTPKGPQE